MVGILGEATGDEGHSSAQEVSDPLLKHKMNAQLLLPNPQIKLPPAWS